MKIIEKKEFKGIIKIIAFFVTFAVILQVLSVAVFTINDAAKYNNKYANAYSYMLEPENTIQVVSLGNSDLYSAIAPTVVWQTSGNTCTNIASPWQSIRQSYLMLEQFLQVQSPKVVVLETDMLYNANPDRNKDYENDAGETFLDTLFDRADPDNVDDFIKSKFSIFVFHDKWKAAFKSQKKAQRDLASHGYHLSLKVKKSKVKDYMKESEYEDPLSSTNYKGFLDIVNLCKSKGIEVLLMEVPSINSWSYERHNAMVHLAEEQGLKFLDFNVLWKEIGIDKNNDFRDRGNHMNYYGAQKVSKYFGEYLQSEYALEDLRDNPDYQFWNDSVVEFQKAVDAEEADKLAAQALAEEETTAKANNG